MQIGSEIFMFTKLEQLKQRYDELSAKLNEPDIMNDRELWKKMIKEHSNLSDIVEKYEEYKTVLDNINESKLILEESSDEELRMLAKEELKENSGNLEKIENEIKILLLPKDPNDQKNVIVEIRGGAGGDEAALFAGDLFRMYSHYAESRNWKTEILNMNESDIGGFKEIVFMINGKGAYSRLKYESGVHRVQRVPETESSGRIHTSTVTVAILPEAEDVDVDINQNDLRIDVFRSSGNGGQSVNTTDSAVRVTHIPTGIVISCQDEKSQLKNKDKALKILRAKLYELELERQQKELSQTRKSQVGTGDRSERIRTYNFPQGRVTDHRINLTLYRLDSILNGDLDEIIDALITTDQAEKLNNNQNK
jgi:peptide chain release factor 1